VQSGILLRLLTVAQQLSLFPIDLPGVLQ